MLNYNPMACVQMKQNNRSYEYNDLYTLDRLKRNRRFNRVIGFINEIVMCLYITIKKLFSVKTVSDPISDKKRI